MRLIDADSLFNKLFVRNGKERPDNGYKNYQFTLDTKYIKEAIRNEPTAYDVDKVVEQLEEKILNTSDTQIGISARMSFGKAIEIVKSGGIE